MRRLQWFSKGFYGVTAEDGRVVISDLRMGFEPDYVFRFAVARRGNPQWQPIPPRQIPTIISREDVARVWERMFRP